MTYFIKEEDGGTYAVWYRAPSQMEHIVFDARPSLKTAAQCQAMLELYDDDPAIQKRADQRTKEIVEEEQA